MQSAVALSPVDYSIIRNALDAVLLSHREQAFNFACRPRSAPTHNYGQSWADTERPSRFLLRIPYIALRNDTQVGRRPIVERIPWSRLGCFGCTPLDLGFEVLVSGRIRNLQVARENVEDASQVRGGPEYWNGTRRRPEILVIHSYLNVCTLPQSLPAIRHLYCGLNQSFTQNLRFGRVHTDTGCALKVGDFRASRG